MGDRSERVNQEQPKSGYTFLIPRSGFGSVVEREAEEALAGGVSCNTYRAALSFAAQFFVC